MLIITEGVEGESVPQDSLHERGDDCVLPFEATLDPDEHLAWGRWNKSEEIFGDADISDFTSVLCYNWNMKIIPSNQ